MVSVFVFPVVVFSIFFQGVLSGPSPPTGILGWNSLVHAEIFPVEINGIRSVKSALVAPEHLTNELESVLNEPGNLEQIYGNYQSKFEGAVPAANEKVLDAFQKNLVSIARHNLDHHAGTVSWTEGVNQFTHMTAKEFHRVYTNAGSADEYIKALGLSRNQTSEDFSKIKPAADSVDWRNGYVTPIKQQGDCGSCYAFASISVLESVYAIKNNKKLLDLSEQELVDCSGAYHNNGCGGGNSFNSFEYMKGGISTEADYPYQGVQQDCQETSAKIVPIRSYGWVNPPSETSAAAVVAVYGPASILINSGGWQHYRSGEFQQVADNGVFVRGCGAKLDGESNHLVSIVGFTRDYWILKNSWGTEWGEAGFMRLKKGKNMCGIADTVAYIKALA